MGWHIAQFRQRRNDERERDDADEGYVSEEWLLPLRRGAVTKRRRVHRHLPPGSRSSLSHQVLRCHVRFFAARHALSLAAWGHRKLAARSIMSVLQRDRPYAARNNTIGRSDRICVYRRVS